MGSVADPEPDSKESQTFGRNQIRIWKRDDMNMPVGKNIKVVLTKNICKLDSVYSRYMTDRVGIRIRIMFDPDPDSNRRYGY